MLPMTVKKHMMVSSSSRRLASAGEKFRVPGTPGSRLCVAFSDRYLVNGDNPEGTKLT